MSNPPLRQGNVYLWPPPPAVGQQYDSVTSVLQVISKPALYSWYAKMTAEWTAANFEEVTSLMAKDPEAAIAAMKGAPTRTRDKAADLGSLVHRIIERYAKGDPLLLDANLPSYPFLRQFQDFLERYKPVILASECTVFNKTYNYAGTLDMIAMMGTNIWQIDVKTGSGVYAEAALQMAAYANGEFQGLPNGEMRALPSVTQGAVLHLRPEGWKLIPARIDEEIFRAFRAARALHSFMTKIGRAAIGTPFYEGKA